MPRPTRALLLCLLPLLSLLDPRAAEAKAHFAPFEKMVGEADAIVVLELLSSRPERPAEADRHCKDTLAQVRVERVIVGGREPIGEIRIPCFFPCALVESPPGRYLVFLEVRDGLLTSSNWHLSLLPLTGDSVRWYGKDPSTKDALPLREAVEQIQKIRVN